MVRFYEILPGALAWTTILAMVLFSWQFPAGVAIFIILFDVYWLLKTIYLAFHLRVTFSSMRANLQKDWINLLDQENADWKRLYHLVVFPMYQEPYEVVRESFESLARANYPKERFLVVLATEAAAGTRGAEVADRIQEEFGSRFSAMIVTTHPAHLPGELPGKGANETWGVKQAKEILIDQKGIPREDVIVSVFDVDTQIFSEYFGRLAHAFLNANNRLRAIYQPIPLFTNNVYQAPALARIVSFSSTFWQMMQQARPERLTTFSSQSIPLPALLAIGYWHTNIVSEDSRIFWQCFLHYNGDFKVVPLEYPVSMDANVAPTLWNTMKNLYLQQRRWGWGAENIPYMLHGFRINSTIPRRTKLFWTFNVLEGFHSWSTNALMIFALGWLPLLLGGSFFNESLLSYSLPRVTRFIIGLSMIGVATSAIMSISLLPPKPRWFRMRHYLLYILQWILLPVTLIVFGAFPGLEAQTRLMLGGRWRLGFWVTPKGRYSKP